MQTLTLFNHLTAKRDTFAAQQAWQYVAHEGIHWPAIVYGQDGASKLMTFMQPPALAA